MDGMTLVEKNKLINQYIGVGPTGFLADFTKQSLKDFYPAFCDLNIDPNEIEDTRIRARFETILDRSSPADLAKIIRGSLKRFRPESSPHRTQNLHDELFRIARRLEGGAVESPQMAITSEVVRRAIDDAEKLIRVSGATSGVDRIHTALHGYLKDICKKAVIDCGNDPSMTVLFKGLRERHRGFTASGPRADDVTRVMYAVATIMDAMNPIRNNASMAHPKELLEEPEAMLVINTARTILHYLDAKLA